MNWKVTVHEIFEFRVKLEGLLSVPQVVATAENSAVLDIPPPTGNACNTNVASPVLVTVNTWVDDATPTRDEPKLIELPDRLATP